MLWTEKYRPTTFDEIVGNTGTIKEIESEVKSGNMNHMMFLGPAGIGKTTTASVIANHLYGGESASHFLELNASDERGIDVIRNQVKKFAGRKVLDGKHKIIFLDEADSLTRDAQQALRRVMENYQDSCRFILTGNYQGGLIDPIRSRCSVHKFEPVGSDEAVKRLKEICEAEGIEVEDGDLEKLAEVYSGDLRKQINKLQALSAQDEIDFEQLESGQDYRRLFKFVTSRNFPAAKKMANEDNLRHLYNYVMGHDEIPGRVKADVSITFAKYQWRIDRSPDKQIQINALVAELIKAISEHIDNG